MALHETSIITIQKEILVKTHCCVELLAIAVCMTVEMAPTVRTVLYAACVTAILLQINEGGVIQTREGRYHGLRLDINLLYTMARYKATGFVLSHFGFLQLSLNNSWLHNIQHGVCKELG